MWQLRLSKITERESAIGFYIIQNLDENGYLALTLDEICSVTEARLKRPKHCSGAYSFSIRSAWRRGICANVLLIQLENLQLRDSLAARIVDDYLSFLESSATKNWPKIWLSPSMRSPTQRT